MDSSLSSVLTSGSGMNKASVSQQNFWDVVGKSRVIKNNNKDGINPPFPGKEIVRRALELIGPHPYNIFWNNCEHYASLCRNGTPVSFQVSGALIKAGIGVAVVVVGFVAYKLYVHREQVATTINYYCRLVVDGIKHYAP